MLWLQQLRAWPRPAPSIAGPAPGSSILSRRRPAAPPGCRGDSYGYRPPAGAGSPAQPPPRARHHPAPRARPGQSGRGSALTQPVPPALLVWCCKGAGRVTVYWERQPLCIRTDIDRCTDIYTYIRVHTDKYMYIHVGITYVCIYIIYIHYSIYLIRTTPQI